MELLTLDLPWPPTINHYWGQQGKRKFLTPKAQAFRWDTLKAFKAQESESFAVDDKLSVSIMLYPPDYRRRDIDNICKGLLDAMQHAGIFFDDYQINELHIFRMPINMNKCTVTISCL